MFRLFVSCLLLLASGCQINRSFAPVSPSQIFGSERGRQGIADLERGDIDKAEKKLEDAVKYSKNDINIRRHYAEVLWQQGKHQESLRQLDEAVKRSGQNNASLYISLAEKHLAIREYATAYRYADEAVRLAAYDAQSWTLRGRAKRLQAIHRSDNAEQMSVMFQQSRDDYLRAVSLTPNDRELLIELATVQMDCGQPEQALITWLTIQSFYPQGNEPNEVLIGKTETLAILQRFDEVESHLASIQQRGLEHTEVGRRLHNVMSAARNNVQR